MLYTHSIEFGQFSQFELIFVCNIDSDPAEPEVGLMSPSFEVTDIEVEAFGDHNRNDHPGCESNWLALDAMIEKLLDTDQDEWQAVIDGATDQAEENWLCRNV